MASYNYYENQRGDQWVHIDCFTKIEWGNEDKDDDKVEGNVQIVQSTSQEWL